MCCALQLASGLIWHVMLLSVLASLLSRVLWYAADGVTEEVFTVADMVQLAK